MKSYSNNAGVKIMSSKLTNQDLEEITSKDVEVESKLFFYLTADADAEECRTIADAKASEVDERFEFRSQFERKNGLTGFFYVIPDIV